jgi:hypothetical protein
MKVRFHKLSIVDTRSLHWNVINAIGNTCMIHAHDFFLSFCSFAQCRSAYGNTASLKTRRHIHIEVEYYKASVRNVNYCWKDEF